MNKEELKEVFKVRDDFLISYPKWRKGQALFNAIFYVNQEIGNKIRATDIDPFYNDDKIEDCIKFIQGA